MKSNVVDINQQNIPLQSVESHWKQIFDKYDRNRDGKIPLSEICRAIQSTTFRNDIPKHAVQKLLRQFDKNQDGYLSFPEFLYMIEHDEGRHLFKHWMNAYIHHTIPGTKTKRTSTVTDGEYEDEYSCSPPPIGMLIISLIEIGFFAYDLASKHPGYVDGPAASQFIYNPYRRKEAWRFVTYMFVHVGPFHLIVNLLVQILLGIPLEMVHGWFKVLVIYIGGVIAGSLGTSVSDPGVYLAGASGGVYAIIAAHLATIIMNWSEMQFAFVQFLTFLLLVLVDVGSAVYQRYILNISAQIGYAAHLTGALAGLLLGLRILRNLQVHSWEKKVYWSALVLYCLLMSAAIIWNIIFTDHFPPQIV